MANYSAAFCTVSPLSPQIEGRPFWLPGGREFVFGCRNQAFGSTAFSAYDGDPLHTGTIRAVNPYTGNVETFASVARSGAAVGALAPLNRSFTYAASLLQATADFGGVHLVQRGLHDGGAFVDRGPATPNAAVQFTPLWKVWADIALYESSLYGLRSDVVGMGVYRWNAPESAGGPPLQESDVLANQPTLLVDLKRPLTGPSASYIFAASETATAFSVVNHTSILVGTVGPRHSVLWLQAASLSGPWYLYSVLKARAGFEAASMLSLSTSWEDGRLMVWVAGSMPPFNGFAAKLPADNATDFTIFGQLECCGARFMGVLPPYKPYRTPPSPSPTPSASPSGSASSSASPSSSLSVSPSPSESASPSVTASNSVAGSVSPSASASPSATTTSSSSPSTSGSTSVSPSVSPSPSISRSQGSSASSTGSITESASPAPPSMTSTITASATLSGSATASATASISVSSSASLTAQPSPIICSGGSGDGSGADDDAGPPMVSMYTAELRLTVTLSPAHVDGLLSLRQLSLAARQTAAGGASGVGASAPAPAVRAACLLRLAVAAAALGESLPSFSAAALGALLTHSAPNSSAASPGISVRIVALRDSGINASAASHDVALEEAAAGSDLNAASGTWDADRWQAANNGSACAAEAAAMWSLMPSRRLLQLPSGAAGQHPDGQSRLLQSSDGWDGSQLQTCSSGASSRRQRQLQGGGSSGGASQRNVRVTVALTVRERSSTAAAGCSPSASPSVSPSTSASPGASSAAGRRLQGSIAPSASPTQFARPPRAAALLGRALAFAASVAGDGSWNASGTDAAGLNATALAEAAFAAASGGTSPPLSLRLLAAAAIAAQEAAVLDGAVPAAALLAASGACLQSEGMALQPVTETPSATPTPAKSLLTVRNAAGVIAIGVIASLLVIVALLYCKYRRMVAALRRRHAATKAAEEAAVPDTVAADAGADVDAKAAAPAATSTAVDAGDADTNASDVADGDAAADGEDDAEDDGADGDDAEEEEHAIEHAGESDGQATVESATSAAVDAALDPVADAAASAAATDAVLEAASVPRPVSVDPSLLQRAAAELVEAVICDFAAQDAELDAEMAAVEAEFTARLAASTSACQAASGMVGSEAGASPAEAVAAPSLAAIASLRSISRKVSSGRMAADAAGEDAVRELETVAAAEELSQTGISADGARSAGAAEGAAAAAVSSVHPPRCSAFSVGAMVRSLHAITALKRSLARCRKRVVTPALLRRATELLEAQLPLPSDVAETIAATALTAALDIVNALQEEAAAVADADGGNALAADGADGAAVVVAVEESDSSFETAASGAGHLRASQRMSAIARGATPSELERTVSPLHALRERAPAGVSATVERIRADIRKTAFAVSKAGAASGSGEDGGSAAASAASARKTATALAVQVRDGRLPRQVLTAIVAGTLQVTAFEVERTLSAKAIPSSRRLNIAPAAGSPGGAAADSAVAASGSDPSSSGPVTLQDDSAADSIKTDSGDARVAPVSDHSIVAAVGDATSTAATAVVDAVTSAAPHEAASPATDMTAQKGFALSAEVLSAIRGIGAEVAGRAVQQLLTLATAPPAAAAEAAAGSGGATTEAMTTKKRPMGTVGSYGTRDASGPRRGSKRKLAKGRSQRAQKSDLAAEPAPTGDASGLRTVSRPSLSSAGLRALIAEDAVAAAAASGGKGSGLRVASGLIGRGNAAGPAGSSRDGVFIADGSDGDTPVRATNPLMLAELAQRRMRKGSTPARGKSGKGKDELKIPSFFAFLLYHAAAFFGPRLCGRLAARAAQLDVIDALLAAHMISEGEAELSRARATSGGGAGKSFRKAELDSRKEAQLAIYMRTGGAGGGGASNPQSTDAGKGSHVVDVAGKRAAKLRGLLKGKPGGAAALKVAAASQAVVNPLAASAGGGHTAVRRGSVRHALMAAAAAEAPLESKAGTAADAAATSSTRSLFSHDGRAGHPPSAAAASAASGGVLSGLRLLTASLHKAAVASFIGSQPQASSTSIANAPISTVSPLVAAPGSSTRRIGAVKPQRRLTFSATAVSNAPALSGHGGHDDDDGSGTVELTVLSPLHAHAASAAASSAHPAKSVLAPENGPASFPAAAAALRSRASVAPVHTSEPVAAGRSRAVDAALAAVLPPSWLPRDIASSYAVPASETQNALRGSGAGLYADVEPARTAVKSRPASGCFGFGFDDEDAGNVDDSLAADVGLLSDADAAAAEAEADADAERWDWDERSLACRSERPSEAGTVMTEAGLVDLSRGSIALSEQLRFGNLGTAGLAAVASSDESSAASDSRSSRSARSSSTVGSSSQRDGRSHSRGSRFARRTLLHDASALEDFMGARLAEEDGDESEEPEDGGAEDAGVPFDAHLAPATMPASANPRRASRSSLSALLGLRRDVRSPLSSAPPATEVAGPPEQDAHPASESMPAAAAPAATLLASPQSLPRMPSRKSALANGRGFALPKPPSLKGTALMSALRLLAPAPRAPPLAPAAANTPPAASAAASTAERPMLPVTTAAVRPTAGAALQLRSLAPPPPPVPALPLLHAPTLLPVAVASGNSSSNVSAASSSSQLLPAISVLAPSPVPPPAALPPMQLRRHASLDGAASAAAALSPGSVLPRAGMPAPPPARAPVPPPPASPRRHGQ